MKRIVKYTVFAMMLLIVLIFSESSVFASVKPPADKVAGSGTRTDPYIIDMGASSSKRIVLKPEEIPFYFVVRGTGGVGGVFVMDYDIDTGLVSFLLDRSVNSSDGVEKTSVYVTKADYDTHVQQLGVKYNAVSEDKTSFPTYDIQEILLYNNTAGRKPIEGGSTITAEQRKFWFIDFLKKDRYSVLRTLNLSNVSLQASYSDMSRGDMYFFANQPKTQKEVDELFESSGYSSNHSDSEYWVYNKDGFETVSIGNELKLDNGYNFSILYCFGGKSNSALSNSNLSEKNTVEAIFTRLLLVIGDDFLLKMLIQGLFGKDLTINSLIFNTYDGTKLNFYSKSTNELTSVLSRVVNTWYKIFSSLAYILYVIILVYIGVMIIASSGTPNQDKMKKSLGDWFVGLAIMLAVPTFVIPSLIKLNDAFVKFMYNKNSEQVTSYYTVYDSADDIIGGDSSTLSIEELLKKRNEESQNLQSFEEEKTRLVNEIIDKIGSKLSYTMSDDERSFLEDRFFYLYENAKIYVFEKESGEGSFDGALFECVDAIRRRVRGGSLNGELASITYRYLKSDTEEMKELLEKYKEIYDKETTINAIDQLIEVKSTDLMTIMRAYAGEYQRIVFAVVWFSLLFQLIALIFIYYKRIFVIAILIAIFPLIMIFYCIDKMADGSAQTLSMWFNELLSNIFIQSIHCIMYTVLVQMGLEIYKADPSNWFLFLAAMLLLVPAEKILREIFGLGGRTLGKLGGLGMKSALGAIAAAKLVRKGAKGFVNKVTGRKDKAFVDKMNKNFNKLQRRQNRADMRAATRKNDRKAEGRTELTGWERFREQAYKDATKVREFKAKYAPKVAKAARAAKTAASVTAGVVYGVAVDGDVMNKLTQGVHFTEQLMGGQGKTVSRKNAKIKTELSSAYKRKAEKEKEKK